LKYDGETQFPNIKKRKAAEAAIIKRERALEKSYPACSATVGLLK
jgi:hypothetical protein